MIIMKLYRMIGIWVRFIIQVPKFGVPSSKRNWDQKHAKFLGDFMQLQTLIVNVTWTSQDIQNHEDRWLTEISPTLVKKSG